MSRTYVPRDEFVKAATDGVVSDDTIIRKQFICDEIKASKVGSTDTRQFVVSTAAVDRDNDSISPKGWNLDNYRKNPVVLFAHDYTSLPLGKCNNIRVVGGKLVGDVEFADHEMATTVLRLVDGGFLNATSVGFRPIKYQMNETRKGVDFEEQELLEFSIVPVPANPEALIVNRELVGDVNGLKAWAQDVLKALGETETDLLGVKLVKAKTDKLTDALTRVEALETTLKTAIAGLKAKPTVPPLDAGQEEGSAAEEADESDAEEAAEPDSGQKPKPKKPEPPKAADVALLVVRILKGGCECMVGGDHNHDGCTCCKSGDCDGTCCSKAAMTVAKRGRVLSAKNEAKIRAAHGHLNDVLDCLPDEIETAAAAVVEKDAEIVLDLDALITDDVDVELDDLREVMRGVLAETVRASMDEIVKTETQSAVNRARGRLD